MRCRRDCGAPAGGILPCGWPTESKGPHQVAEQEGAYIRGECLQTADRLIIYAKQTRERRVA
jgi:hypothetical protein